MAGCSIHTHFVCDTELCVTLCVCASVSVSECVRMCVWVCMCVCVYGCLPPSAIGHVLLDHVYRVVSKVIS